MKIRKENIFVYVLDYSMIILMLLMHYKIGGEFIHSAFIAGAIFYSGYNILAILFIGVYTLVLIGFEEHQKAMIEALKKVETPKISFWINLEILVRHGALIIASIWISNIFLTVLTMLSFICTRVLLAQIENLRKKEIPENE